MNSDRIKEIQETTAYPQSISVYKALLQVWNECVQNPEWIPIIDGDLSGLPNSRIWVTAIHADRGLFVSQQLGESVKKGADVLSKVVTAWMPYTEPKPWRP